MTDNQAVPKSEEQIPLKFETSRLYFEQFKREDIDKAYELLQIPEVTTYLWFCPIDRQGVEGYFGSIVDRVEKNERGEYLFSVYLKPEQSDATVGSTGPPSKESCTWIGTSALTLPPVDAPGVSEFGFQYLPLAWGKGIGTESLRVLLDFAFTKLNYRKVFTTVMEGNIGSCKCSLKANFVKEATLREHYLKDGKYRDCYHFGLLKRDWQPVDKLVTYYY